MTSDGVSEEYVVWVSDIGYAEGRPSDGESTGVPESPTDFELLGYV